MESTFLRCQWHLFFNFQINIDYQMREETAKRAQDPTHTSFDEAQKTVYILMERDSYPRFLKSKAYLNLLNQLQTNTSKWSVWGSKEPSRLCQISCREILQEGWILARRTPALGRGYVGDANSSIAKRTQDNSWVDCYKGESSTGRKPSLPVRRGVKMGYGCYLLFELHCEHWTNS